MAKNEKYTKELVESVILSSGGVYPASAELGISPRAIYDYAKRHKEVSFAIDRINDKKAQRRAAKRNYIPCVYFIVDGVFGYTKIGYTLRSLSSRVSRLRVGCPQDIELVGCIFCDDDVQARWLEGALHKRFAKKHKRGEWFDIDDADMESLALEYKISRRKNNSKASNL